MDTATNLFSKNGYHATGIDAIIEEAGVSRMSLYNNFTSKDALIEAVLSRHHERIAEWVKGIIESADDANVRFDRLFDEFGRRWSSDDFHGCPFVNAIAEYSDADHPVHQFSRNHKEQIEGLLSKLALDIGSMRPDETASQLMLIVDGGAFRAHLLGDKLAHETARAAARAVVDASKTP